jgi:hypothetical protein
MLIRFPLRPALFADQGLQKVNRPLGAGAWKVVTLIGLAVALFFGGAGTAAACSCALPENRQGALERMSRYDVIFTGTLVRTFPGVSEYRVDKVYAGNVAARVLVTSPDSGNSCSPGRPPRGQSTLFLGTGRLWPITAAEADMCGFALSTFRDGQSAKTSELAHSLYGDPSSPRHTPTSWALRVLEWPLTWLADRRVQIVLAVLALAGYITHYVRSRYGRPPHSPVSSS